MKSKNAKAHMHVAYIYANLSHCNRRKVGCVIVKHDSIIAIGYNGTPSGEDNCCEDDNTKLTKDTVIHAEDNALRKLTKQYESAIGSDVFVTTAPCKLCAVRLADAGVKKVYYSELYQNTDGIQYLRKRNIEVEQLQIQNYNGDI